MLKKITLGLAIALTASTAMADPVQDRTQAMDQIRKGAATLVPMIKGKTEFDATIAELALRMTFAGALAFQGDHFPAGSKSKGANPAIWENLDDFNAKRAGFVANARAAIKNFPQDLDGLKAVYQPLLKDCAACHKPYRIKEQ